VSLPTEISCQGAPRDLGLDQGTACAEAIRDRVRCVGGRGDWLGRWRPFDGGLARDRLTRRDLKRHFPHLEEWLIGLARGADVPEIALASLLARELGTECEGGALRAGFDAGGRIVAHPPSPGVLRRVAPDHGFASVEWTLPWLPGALAGVNRTGLAGAVVSRAAEDAAACAAPAFLLLQNCLAQFETVDAAAEWCERRPAGGQAELLFADARGGRAAVSVAGEKRGRLEPARGTEPGGDAGGLRLLLDAEAPALEATAGQERRWLEP